MPRNKYPEITENKILEKAMGLFIEKGYEQTTLQDVANAMGMTRGAIYGHFKSKEQMVDAVTSYMFDKAVPLVEIRDNKQLYAIDKMKKLFTASLLSEDQLNISLAISKSFYNNPKIVAAYMKSNVENLVSILLSLIEEGQKDGSIKVKDSEIVAELLSVIMNIWLSPMVFSETQDKFKMKLNYAKKLLDFVGLPLIDKDVENAFGNLINALPSEE